MAIAWIAGAERAPNKIYIFPVLLIDTGRNADYDCGRNSTAGTASGKKTMTLEQIKRAVEDGKKVHWSNESYDVIKDGLGQWMIMCRNNNSCIGLTWMDGVTLNAKERDFYIDGERN